MKLPLRFALAAVVAGSLAAFHVAVAAPIAGGNLGSPGATRDPLDWWSLKPLAHESPPGLAGIPIDWSGNPIDRFVFARLAQDNLVPSAPADRRTLIRRVSYDLLGLPPTAEEVDAFVQDPDPKAYERLVDRLLASPHYGERWGRHWLDVIRFGESRGFERNEIIPSAWPFRDYVVRSFNDDKPFDRFVVEQFAGDVIAKDNPEIEIGTAFLVAGPYDDVGNQDPVQARIIRANTIDDMVAATGGGFLGLTLQCARCHDHKFDPIAAADYYRIAAIFAGTTHAERNLATPEQRRSREEILRPLEAQRAAAQQALEALEESVLHRADTSSGKRREFSLPIVHPHLTEDRFPSADARFVRMTIESNNRDPRSGANVRIDEFEVWTDEPNPRNVALASTGAQVQAPTREAEDFAGAYAPALVIDGVYGARWVSPRAGALTITLSNVQRISRVSFSADRTRALPPDSGEIPFVGEYRLEISVDGEHWQGVADSRDRPPVNEAFARERRFQANLSAEERAQWRELQRALSRAREALAAVPPLAQAWAGRFEAHTGPYHVFKGGSPERPGEEVRPGSPSTLQRVTRGFELDSDAAESERRLALGRWLVQPDNPLTPRVLANRVWHYHFGIGLVDTPSDFGRLGSLPSHPELLEWLAGWLVDHGWRLKPLHRLIVLSQTYRQATAWREGPAAADADSRLLWRFPPRRLDAEEIRDSMLQTAGVLNTRLGGPGFKLYRYLQDNVATYLPLDHPGPETYRRSIYHHNARASVVDLMSDFDQPDCAFSTPRRAATTSPLQALTLLNHAFTTDMAAALARRIERDMADGTPAADQLARRAFQLAYQRPPSVVESAEAAAFLARHGLPALGRVLFNSNEFLYLE